MMKNWNQIPTIKALSSSLHVNSLSIHLTSAPRGDCCNLCTPSCENSVCTSEKKWHPLCYPRPGRDRCRKNGRSGSCSSHSAGDKETAGGLPVLVLNFRQMTHCVRPKKTIVSANGDRILCPCQSLDFWASGSQSVWVWRRLTARWSMAMCTQKTRPEERGRLGCLSVFKYGLPVFVDASLGPVREAQLFSLDFLCLTCFCFIISKYKLKLPIIF